MWREGSILVGCARKKMAPIFTPHNSVCPRSCQEPELSGARLLGVGRVGLADLLWWGGTAQVHRNVAGVAPTPKPWHPLGFYQPSTPWPRQLTPQQGASSKGWGCYIPAGWHPEVGSAPPKKDGIYSVGEGLSTGNLAAVPSALPQNHKPQLSSHDSTPFYLASFGTQGEGCKWDFVCWSFKRAPVSLADSCLLLVGKIPSDSHSQMLCGHLFLAMVLWAGELDMGLRAHTPQWEFWQLT